MTSFLKNYLDSTEAVHAAAVAAVATVGAATRDKLLAAEAATTVAPLASFNLNSDAIDKHREKKRMHLAAHPLQNSNVILLARLQA